MTGGNGGAYGGRPPFVKGSDTSEAAADSIESTGSSMRYKVLAFIKRAGDRGATDDEVEVGLEMRHQTASARRRELVLSGHVHDSGNRRPTRSGRGATVWKPVTRKSVSDWLWELYTDRKEIADKPSSHRGQQLSLLPIDVDEADKSK